MNLAALFFVTINHDASTSNTLDDDALAQVCGGLSLYPESGNGPHTQGAPNEVGNAFFPYPTSGG